MREIIRTLTEAQTFEKTGKIISEIDTQVILVELVLSLAGHAVKNPFFIKRSSRSRIGNEFDIEVYANGRLKIAIEVKGLSSKEYNIDNSGAGQLFEYCSAYKGDDKSPKACELKWSETGGARTCKYHADCKNYSANNTCTKAVEKFGNVNQDGLGQLRAYCLNFAHYEAKTTMAVLTNGEEWVIFGRDFTENPFSPIQKPQIEARKKITDSAFCKEIINKLK
jgi:hypothetical protein